MSLDKLREDHLQLQNEGKGDSFMPVVMNANNQVYYGRLPFTGRIFSINGLEQQTDPEKWKEPVDGRVAVCLLFQLYGKLVPYDANLLPRINQKFGAMDHGPLRKLIVETCGRNDGFQKILGKFEPLFLLSSNSSNVPQAAFASMDEDWNPKIRLIIYEGFDERVVYISLNGQVYDGNSHLVLNWEQEGHNLDISNWSDSSSEQ